jgi:hypothetical protein
MGFAQAQGSNHFPENATSTLSLQNCQRIFGNIRKCLIINKPTVKVINA